jgi:anti-sigma factor RsiW
VEGEMITQCHRSARDVLLYRDGELAPLEQEDFARHLPDCPSCRGRLLDANALGSIVRQAFEQTDVSLSEGFTDRVMKEVRRRSPQPTRTWSPQPEVPWLQGLLAGWRWLAVGGLALAAAAAAVLLPLRSASHGSPAEAEQAALQQENEAHVHRLTVESPDTHTMVMQTAAGRTVIWMISDSQFGGDAGAESPRGGTEIP